jgi:hypothetical protein
VRISGEAAAVNEEEVEKEMKEIRRFLDSLSVPSTESIIGTERAYFIEVSHVNCSNALQARWRKTTKITHYRNASGCLSLIYVNGDGTDSSLVLIGTAKTPRNTNKFWDNLGIKFYSNNSA